MPHHRRCANVSALEKKKTAPDEGAVRFAMSMSQGLLRGEASRNCFERDINFATDRSDSGDDDNRNAGRDQAIFDRGRAALVLQETLNQLHIELPVSEGHRPLIRSANYHFALRNLKRNRDSCTLNGCKIKSHHRCVEYEIADHLRETRHLDTSRG
jgi:hypothetical protein